MKVVITPDVLLNQLRRDAVHISASFDELFDADLAAISGVLAQALEITAAGMVDTGRKNKDLSSWSVVVLLNVSNSLSASAYVLRAGYRLVPGVILRSSLEALAVCLHGLLNPQDLSRIKSGSFKPTAALPSAKQVFPPFGQLYGYLSEQFTHAGPLHQSLQPLTKYTERDDAVAVNLQMLRTLTWMLYVVAEFAFIDLVPSPKYWKRDGPHKVWYMPDDDVQSWQARFLHGHAAV